VRPTHWREWPSDKQRPARRFPQPWAIDEHAECFIVCDAAGRHLGYFYYDDERHRRSINKRLAKDQSRRIAANIAKLPVLLRRNE
jgi:hypothetical protein